MSATPWLCLLALINQSDVLSVISVRVIELPVVLHRAPAALSALRALRLVQHQRELQSLVTTIMISIPSLINVASLLALVVFIYSVLGVQLFTFIERGVYFTHERNFDDFGHAMLTNVQALTGDGWSTLMYEALADETHGSSLAIPFFVSFQVLCSLVILNLVVAVILENFTSLGGGNTDLVSRADVELFSEIWADFDPDANQHIPIALLPDVLKALPQPLGLRGAPRSWVVRVCLNLGLEAKGGGELAFRDVLNLLVKFNFQQQMRDELPAEGEKAAEALKAAEQAGADSP